MKILQIIQRPQLRGAEIFASQLSVELVKLGHKVDVVYLFSAPFRMPFPLNYISLKAKKSRRFYDIKGYHRLARIVREGGYDIVQANAADTLKYAVLSKIIFGWDAALIYRNASKMGDFIRSKFQRLLHRWLLSKSDFIISVTENARQDITQLFPGVKDRTITIPIGTYDFEDIQAFQDSPRRPVLINVSSFVKEKNHIFLIEVFKEFREKSKEAVLWLVGDGPQRSLIEQRIRHYDLGDRVKLWGYRDDAVAILKAADIFVMPSRIEGLPGVILEALSCGVPVVASSAGGIGEVIIDNFTGHCVAPFDVELYVERIGNLLFNEKPRQRVITNGKNIINERFLMPQIAKRFITKYSEILRSS